MCKTQLISLLAYPVVPPKAIPITKGETFNDGVTSCVEPTAWLVFGIITCFGSRAGRTTDLWKNSRMEECKRFILDDWAGDAIDAYQIGPQEDGGPSYDVLNLSDGQSSCFGVKPLVYAKEVECRPGSKNVTNLGEVDGSDSAKILGTKDCLKMMEDIVDNPNGRKGTIYSKSVVLKSGHRKNLCFRLKHSDNGPTFKECNATKDVVRINSTGLDDTRTNKEGHDTISINPTWLQHGQTAMRCNVYYGCGVPTS